MFIQLLNYATFIATQQNACSFVLSLLVVVTLDKWRHADQISFYLSLSYLIIYIWNFLIMGPFSKF